MKVFDSYAKYYDLLYADKDYKSEVNYIEKIFFHSGKKNGKILNLGCGTGRHDFIFAEDGYDVTGIEISNEMLRIAKKNLTGSGYKSKIKFQKGDLKKISLGKKFDIVLALFHVMSYQTSTEDIKSSLRNVKQHLKKDGIFVFDFWYGPAVLSDRPEIRTKKFYDSNMIVQRKAIPVLKVNENLVDVNYSISIRYKKSGNEKNIKEKHTMRYLFLPEIEYLLNDAGLKLKSCKEWMTGKVLSEKSWSALAIAVIK